MSMFFLFSFFVMCICACVFDTFFLVGLELRLPVSEEYLDLSKFKNPVIQQFYSALEALALDQKHIRPIHVLLDKGPKISTTANELVNTWLQK